MPRNVIIILTHMHTLLLPNDGVDDDDHDNDVDDEKTMSMLPW